MQGTVAYVKGKLYVTHVFSNVLHIVGVEKNVESFFILKSLLDKGVCWISYYVTNIADVNIKEKQNSETGDDSGPDLHRIWPGVVCCLRQRYWC